MAKAEKFVTEVETDPSTGQQEIKFHEQVRDILGIDPFARHEAIYAELRRLKRVAHVAEVKGAFVPVDGHGADRR